MPFLIDGYNLLHSIRKTSEDFEPVTDIQLCHILGRFLKRIGDKGRIVFDGTGPRDKTDFDNIANPEVVFSGLGIEADTVIENAITANTAPKRLTVVSSDRRIRKAAHARKAKAVKSELFWIEVLKQLSRKHKSYIEPAEKRIGLTEAETDKWLDFFELDQ